MWTRGEHSLDAAAIALSQNILEDARSHFNQVKERQADLSYPEHQEDVVLLEVLAFEYFLLAHAAFCTQLERQDELLIRVAENLWIYVSSRQSRIVERLAFQEFLDHRLISYIARMKEQDPLVRVADALLENMFPGQPQDGGLLAGFSIYAGGTLLANKRLFVRFAEKLKLV